MNLHLQNILLIISVWLISSLSVFGYNTQDTLTYKEDNAVFYNVMAVKVLNECPYESRSYAYKALQIAINSKNIEEEAKANINYANAVSNLEKFEKALKHYKNALNIYIKENNDKKIAEVSYHIGKTYDKTGKIALAISYYERSKDLALKVENKELLDFVLLELIRLYETKNDSKKAYETFLSYTYLHDVLFDDMKRKQINALHEKYQTEKNTRELKLLSAENEIKNLQLNQIRWQILALTGLTLLTILLSILFIIQNRRKNRQRILELEQKLLRFQMNPHFIFNSLSSIQYLILKNEGNIAIQNLSNFSELTNTIFQSLKTEYVSLETEIHSLKHYFELQKVVLKERLEYFFEVDTDLDVQKVTILPMLLQPLIENSIIHGINNKIEKGNIYVRFVKKEKSLYIEIEDDGIGRENAKKYSKKEHKSFATEITKNRLNNLNTLISKKTSFEIIDLKNEDGSAKGTKVLLKLPLKYLK